MPMFFKPVTVGPDGRQHIVAQQGSVIEVSYIPVSTEVGNLLKSDALGLTVQAKDMVSATAGNLLTVGLDGKLVVEPQELPDFVSKQEGNYARYGVDKGVYVDGNDILSNAVNNLLTISPTDGKVQLTEEALKDAGIGADVTIVSTDAGNILSIGTDKGAMLQAQDVAVGMAGNGLTIEPGTGKLTINADYLADGATIVDNNGKLSVDLAGLVDGNTIRVENGKLATHAEASVAAGDKLLYKTLDGAIGSEFAVAYERATGLLRMFGVNGASLGEVTILGAESVLEDVDFVIDPLGQSPGSYLLFTFRLQNGNAKELYVNMSYLSDIYRAGMGVKIDPDLTVSVRLATDGGLGFNVNGEIQLDGANVGSVILGEMISKDADNTIVLGSDNKLYSAGGLQASDIPELLSVQEGNALKLGLDNKLYVEETKPEDLLSGTADNTLTVGLDGKLYSAPVKPTELVSLQEKNLLTVGLDGKLFAKSTEPTELLSIQAGNKLTLGTDGKLYTSGMSAAELLAALATVVSADTGNAIKLGTDGKLFVALDHGTM